VGHHTYLFPLTSAFNWYGVPAFSVLWHSLVGEKVIPKSVCDNPYFAEGQDESTDEVSPLALGNFSTVIGFHSLAFYLFQLKL
jgi:hypothetical protein